MYSYLPFQVSDRKFYNDRACFTLPVIVSPDRYTKEVTIYVRHDGTFDSTLGDIHNVERVGELVFFDVGFTYPNQPRSRYAVRWSDTTAKHLMPQVESRA